MNAAADMRAIVVDDVAGATFLHAPRPTTTYRLINSRWINSSSGRISKLKCRRKFIPTRPSMSLWPSGNPERFAQRWAGQLFASVTDDLSTNSHFTYSVIGVVDRLVRGVLDP
jgi:hypothetical protein